MDVHRDVEADADDVVEAHRKDVETQEKRGVEYRRYRFDDEASAVFCLFEAPNKEADETVHREAHGLVAGEIYEVEAGR